MIQRTPRSSAVMTPFEFQTLTGIADDDLRRLEAYVEALKKWQKAINLIGPKTIPDIWLRHVFDSAQLADFIGNEKATILDLGSGAGFPAIVLAVMTRAQVHLVESDVRKCAFLAEAKRIVGGEITIHPRRIEKMDPFQPDFITARACAPLPKLLDLSRPFLGKKTVCLFQKGQNVDQELTESTKSWNMRVEHHKSRSDLSGVILKLEGISYDGGE